MEISLLCTNVPLDLGVTPKYTIQIMFKFIYRIRFYEKIKVLLVF